MAEGEPRSLRRSRRLVSFVFLQECQPVFSDGIAVDEARVSEKSAKICQAWTRIVVGAATAIGEDAVFHREMKGVATSSGEFSRGDALMTFNDVSAARPTNRLGDRLVAGGAECSEDRGHRASARTGIS